LALALASGEWTPTPEHPLAVPAFKTPRIASEWATLPPQLTGLVSFLDDWLFSNGMERLTITDAFRTDDEQEVLYFQHYLAKGNSPENARRLARHRPSLHKERKAVDFRHTVRPYTEAERQRIWAKLEELCNERQKWQLDLHNIGTGLHFHVGFRGERERGQV
jgi:hypothetical protein